MTLDTIGDFSWGYGQQFFIETEEGNFVWNDPDYLGDNTISKFEGSLKDWLDKLNIPFCRIKGKFSIGDFCGQKVVFALE